LDFAGFYEGEYAYAVRLAFLLTRSESVCEEIVQEAFLEICKRFETLDQPGAYLRTTIVNNCGHWHDRQARYEAKVHLLGPQPGHTTPVETGLIDVVAKLPYRQRVVVVCRYWGGWTEWEIAELLNCPRGTVKSLASRALAQIRREITDP
jgi:DNA-directed RNA polymerase specialized sigma24 family protein